MWNVVLIDGRSYIVDTLWCASELVDVRSEYGVRYQRLVESGFTQASVSAAKVRRSGLKLIVVALSLSDRLLFISRLICLLFFVCFVLVLL
jgi:hypothetical protein